MSTASAAIDLELPQVIGRYEILRLLGEGAMGRVLLARDPVLDREVALKHLRGDLKIPRDVRQGLVVRMRHEARAAARVAHPNLVTLHDMGEDPEVGLYLVFEYVKGPTLKQRVAEGRMPAEEVAKMARELGDALTEAHEAGILHRDVKPENVIVARTGAKVADFGIARVPDSTLTHQGGLMGTPAYSAPETFKAGTFSAASDQFSLAATLYEALAGKRAFPGDDAVAVASKIASESAAPFAREVGLTAPVDEVLLQAMAREPQLRYPTCRAFGEALALALAPTGIDRAVRAQLATLPRISEPPRERKTLHVVIGAATVIGTAVLLYKAATRQSEHLAPDPAFSSAPFVTASSMVVLPPPPPAATHRATHAHSKGDPSASPSTSASANAPPSPTSAPQASVSANAAPTTSASAPPRTDGK